MVINRLYVLYLFCFNRKYTNTRIKGDMKKSIILIITLAFLNACAEYSALVGSSLTMAKSGSVLHSGTSFASSYAIKKATGQTPGEHALTFVKKNRKFDTLLASNEVRECQTVHSSFLTQVFFETLDDIDCIRDPFSILK